MIRRQFILQAFESPVWLWLCVAIALLAAILMSLLLRSERRLVPALIGRLLLTLRLVVIAALCIVLLEPVLGWSYDVEQTPRVLAAIDVSESMDTADDYAKPVEKLRWARALGLIGNASTDARLDRWQSALEAGQEPVWVADEETQDPAVRAQLAEVRRGNFDDVSAEVSRLSRKEIAARLLTQTAEPLLESFGEFGEVELQVFGGQAARVDETTLLEAIANPDADLLTDTSNLVAPLSSSSSAADSSELVSVVLFTDGRDHSQGEVLEVATRLGSSGTRVFPVVLGSPRKPRDLAINAIDYPPDMLRGDRGLLRATFNTSGFEGEEIEIVLERSNADPLRRKVTPTGRNTRVQFELDAGEQRRVDYTLRAAIQPDELREDNNAQEFHVNVVDDKIDVLLIEGEARWEFRFLDNALSRDEQVDVSQVVFQQPYLGVLDKTFFPQELEGSSESDDSESTPFANYDLVLLGDVPPIDLPIDFWSQLEDYVSKTGGTVVFIAGKRHLPAELDDPSFVRMLPLTDLRPIELAAAPSTTAATGNTFDLRLTNEGAAEPMLQFASEESANRDVWSNLPGHSWGFTGKPKPGATTLATALRPQSEVGTADTSAPILLRQPYGLGHVFWMGIDSTWRWRRRVGDEYHHRFWGQLCRWAVENKAIAGADFVKFGPEQSQYQQDEVVVVRARWTRDFLQKYPAARAAVRLYDAEGSSTTPRATLPMQPLQGRAGVHEARLGLLPAGEYRVELDVEPAIADADPVTAHLRVEQPRSPELADISSNPDLLEQLAVASGGKLLYPDEVGELDELLSGTRRSETQQQEIALWSHWSVLALFCLLLTCEWVIRKVHGLP